MTDIEVVERGVFADPTKKHLLGAATKVIHYNPTIGTELHGIDLRALTDAQKDELYVVISQQMKFAHDIQTFYSALLVAERGVVCECCIPSLMRK